MDFGAGSHWTPAAGHFPSSLERGAGGPLVSALRVCSVCSQGEDLGWGFVGRGSSWRGEGRGLGGQHRRTPSPGAPSRVVGIVSVRGQGQWTVVTGSRRMARDIN